MELLEFGAGTAADDSRLSALVRSLADCLDERGTLASPLHPRVARCSCVSAAPSNRLLPAPSSRRSGSIHVAALSTSRFKGRTACGTRSQCTCSAAKPRSPPSATCSGTAARRVPASTYAGPPRHPRSGRFSFALTHGLTLLPPLAMMDPTPPHTVAPLSHLPQPQLSTIP